MTTDRFAALRVLATGRDLITLTHEELSALLDAADELARMRTHTTLVQNEALADEIHRAERAEVERDALKESLVEMNRQRDAWQEDAARFCAERDRLAVALRFYAARSHFEGMVHIEHARPLACVTVSVEDGQTARAALAGMEKKT